MVMPPRDFLFTAVFRRREQPADVAARLRDRLAAAGLDTDQLLRDAADNDYIMWAFVAHRRSYPSGTDGLRGKALREVVEQRMARWHPVLRRLVAESDPDTIEQFDFAAAAPVKPWPDRSVTLLGDAIHYMPPVGGMGGNTALQDAQRLCAALAAAASGAEPLAAALRDYQAEMLDRGFKTVRGVRLYTRMAISRSRLLRTTPGSSGWRLDRCAAPSSATDHGRPGRAAHDQLGGQLDVQRVDLVAVQQPDQQADRHPAHLGQRLPDRGERRAGGLGQVDVVEAGDGQVRRAPAGRARPRRPARRPPSCR